MTELPKEGQFSDAKEICKSAELNWTTQADKSLTSGG